MSESKKYFITSDYGDGGDYSCELLFEQDRNGVYTIIDAVITKND